MLLIGCEDQVLDANPADGVRGPNHVVKKGKTPVLAGDEARTAPGNHSRSSEKRRAKMARKQRTGNLSGLRDRAVIGVMVYSFARVGAAPQMKVEDYFLQGRRGWFRLHEKGGKDHDVPCHHNLERLLDEYIEAAGIAGDPDGPLFRTMAGKTGVLTGNAMWQQDAYRMIQRRAAVAGIKTRIGNHTFRATGITAYLKNSGKLEVAQHIANHERVRG